MADREDSPPLYPLGWKELRPLREIFLWRVTDPEIASSLRLLGGWLYQLTLDWSRSGQQSWRGRFTMRCALWPPISDAARARWPPSLRSVRRRSFAMKDRDLSEATPTHWRRWWRSSKLCWSRYRSNPSRRMPGPQAKSTLRRPSGRLSSCYTLDYA